MRISSFLPTFAAAAILALLLPASPSQAGWDCLFSCYVEAPLPPVIHRNLKRRVEIQPGGYEVAREPSLYGWVVERVVDPGIGCCDRPVYGYQKKRVLLRPYKNIAIYHQARHKYVRDRVAIQPEGTDYEPLAAPSWWDR